MSIPLYRKKLSGESGEAIAEDMNYPEGVVTDTPESYDVSKRRPDIIITQFPYDGTDTGLTIDERFFTSNLIKCTDRLIYVPHLVPEDPAFEDDKLTAALASYIEQPACIFSDEIILHSERLKETYVKKLTSLSGDNTDEYWKNKIRVLERTVDKSCKVEALEDIAEKQKGRKIILYHLSAGFLVRHGDKAIDKLKRSLEIFKENSDKVYTVISLPAEMDQLRELMPDVTDRLLKTLEDYRGSDFCFLDDKKVFLQHLNNVNGYFGDAGTLARRCVCLGIPVMLENVEI